MTAADLAPLWLTLQLAAIVTVLLLILGTPLAWWLAHSRARFAPVVEAVTALPLVLPPTVLGFYLLIAFNPDAPLGAFWLSVTGHTLTFSFAGLVVASVIYSLPFTVQPLQTGFAALGRAPMEAAASLGAGPINAFLTVATPLCLRGYLTAAVLTFAHTLGEFGVVLMVGGNIPGETRLISIAIYEEVETLDYGTAHLLSGMLLALSFAILFALYALNGRNRVRLGP
ncbi:Molybdenum transport system permease protein ModB [Defluviimonas aquaemixtae]|uniref:Molybdenum transport system permease n=1 Tax=Albidovulum aquaemixtae TaxID=1542388 RepID=A0A2R8B7H6_9RHOB|nr:molybdate ABC transporter permease subunit [Defluviimonas aquaemixtae]SPH18453.1 Molybdenum transport system permease protein ModB [Defluviimonas aquaemixtae]